MSVDLRRFDYALEPLRRQRHWELEALQAELGRVLRRIEESQRALEEQRGRYQEQSERASRALTERLDPSTYPRLLQWLAGERRSIKAAEEGLSEMEEECRRVRARLLAQQQKVEAIEKHREDCVEEFARQEEGRLLSEGDRDWLARREWAVAANAGDGQSSSPKGDP